MPQRVPSYICLCMSLIFVCLITHHINDISCWGFSSSISFSTFVVINPTPIFSRSRTICKPYNHSVLMHPLKTHSISSLRPTSRPQATTIDTMSILVLYLCSINKKFSPNSISMICTKISSSNLKRVLIPFFVILPRKANYCFVMSKVKVSSMFLC